MYSLKIFLHSLEFYNIIFDGNDKIQFDFTTFPEGIKQSFIINACDIKNLNKAFVISITNKIKEIHLVFIKKNIYQKDTIIGSTIIHYTQLPLSLKDRKNNRLQNINIYGPTHYISSENNTVFGKIILYFKLKNNKKCIKQKSKVYNNDENKNENKYLLNNDVFILN